MLTAGIAGAVAGAMSMAAGEYVSVQLAGRQRAGGSRSRAPRARDRRRRRTPRANGHLHEPRARARSSRSKSPTSSRLTTRSAHTRATSSASRKSRKRGRCRPQPLRPQASRAAHCCRSRSPPLLPMQSALVAVPATTLVFLAVLGALAARTGGAPIAPSRWARHVLGRPRDGRHCRHRRALRHDRPVSAVASRSRGGRRRK